MATSPGIDPVRYDFLDWLRVIAIFVLLFFHTGMLFVGWGWHIENAETIPSLRLPMDIAHRLRMPLLFVVAGAGLWFALRRRAGTQVVRERSLRLLLPLAMGMALIVPPQIYYERLFRNQWQGGYLDFLLERVLQFQPYPEGDVSWHHLWFILYLYVYVLAMLPLFIYWRRRNFALRPGAWLYTLGLPLGLNEAILKPWFPEAHTLWNDWYVFNHYLLFTIYGFLLASLRAGWDWLGAHRGKSLTAAAIVTAVALGILSSGIIQPGTAADSFVANVFTWLWIMVFLGYGRHYLSCAGPVLRWARDASYPVYILHQTITIAIGYYVIQLQWGAWTKYAVVLIGTMLGSVLVYELCVRRFAVMRVLFGLKPRPAQIPVPESSPREPIPVR